MTAAEGLVRFTVADIIDTPLYYPVTFDSAGDRILLTRLSEADYRVSSFLDERILGPGTHATWVPQAELAIAARQIKARPLHFIFHSGHVGSTLLSRLLDELPGVLGLREPAPLRTLADDYDRMGLAGGQKFQERLATFLNLWSRGFADTRTVIVKSTSIAARIAPLLLGMAAKARAVYLNVGLESYLATHLAAPGANDDIAVFAPLRHARLMAMLGSPVRATQGRGEVVALAWLTERLNQQTTERAGGERMLAIDFDAMLADLPQALTRITAHLGLKAGPRTIARMAASPILSRYSKAPERHAFTAADRATKLRSALEKNSVEVTKGKAIIAELAVAHETVAALTGIGR
jgi:hypothetical protein